MDQLIVGSSACSCQRIVKSLTTSVAGAVVAGDWSQLAWELGIDKMDINKFRQDMLLDKRNLIDVLINILSLWVLHNGSSATLANLLTHLETLSWQSVIEQLHEDFGLVALSPESSIYKSTLPENPSYYVPRRLVTRNRLSKRIFTQDAKDIYVFTGIPRHKLTSLVKKQITDTSSAQVHKDVLSVRFIILEQSNHWEKLCKKTAHPIHLIHHEDDKLIWLHSRGNVKSLQAAVDKYDQGELSEDMFIDEVEKEHPVKFNQSFCIADSPGMGKSLLLADIGRRVQRKFPDRVVIFIVISEWINSIKEDVKLKESKLESILKNLFKDVSEDENITEALISEITSDESPKPSIRFELLFDGFDEVVPEQVNLAYECLEILLKLCKKTARVWVTTRLHLLTELENYLNVLGFNIEPFGEPDQMRFFKSYWSENETRQVDIDRISTFAQICLTKIKSMLNQKDEDIAGIPLQCLLIAEVFETDALGYADPANKLIPAMPEPSILFEIKSILDLYEGLIQNRIQKFKKLFQHVLFDDRDMKLLHAYHSLHLIYPGYAQVFKDKVIINEDITKEIFNVGILESKKGTGQIRFIHRTFAEYFIAWFLAHCMSTELWSDDLNNFLFQSIFSSTQDTVQIFNEVSITIHKFEQQIICNFLDLHLKYTSTDMSSFSNHLVDISDEILKVCLFSNCVNIFGFLHNLDIVDINPKTFFDAIIAFVIGTYSSLELTQFLDEWREQLPQLSEVNVSVVAGKTVLHIAAWRGDYSVVEYLLLQHGFEAIVRSKHESISDLLHYCLKDSRFDTLAEVQQRGQILHYLARLNRDLLENRNMQQYTPLLRDDLHFVLIQELVQLNVDILAQDGERRVFLHKKLHGVAPKDSLYEKVLQHISAAKMEALVGIRDLNGNTILHNPFIYECVDEETLTFLKENGADFSGIDKQGDSILCTLLQSADFDRLPGKDRILEMLIKAKCTLESSNGNALHVAAACGNMNAVSYFINEMKMPVNIPDKEGRTPFHHTIYGKISASGRYEVARLLKRNKGVLKEKLWDVNSLLLDRVEQLDFVGVRILFDLTKAHAKVANTNGMTPLHLAFEMEPDGDIFQDRDRIEIVKILLEKKSDLNAKNGNGETPLEYVIRHRPTSMNISIYRLLRESRLADPSSAFLWLCKYGASEKDFADLASVLIQQGASVTVTGDGGNTPVHLTAMCNGAEGISYLLDEHSLNVNVQNLEGHTPLHLAMCSIFQETFSERRRESRRMNPLEALEVLLDHQANVYALNHNKETPLFAAWKAVRSKNNSNSKFTLFLKLLRFLLRRRAFDIRTCDENRNTLVHHMLSDPCCVEPSEFHELVEILVQEEAILVFNMKGGKLEVTPLHLAVQNLPVEWRTIQLLNLHGVNFKEVDKNGLSVVSYAEAGGRDSKFSQKLIDSNLSP